VKGIQGISKKNGYHPAYTREKRARRTKPDPKVRDTKHGKAWGIILRKEKETQRGESIKAYSVRVIKGREEYEKLGKKMQAKPAKKGR